MCCNVAYALDCVVVCHLVVTVYHLYGPLPTPSFFFCENLGGWSGVVSRLLCVAWSPWSLLLLLLLLLRCSRLVAVGISSVAVALEFSRVLEFALCCPLVVAMILFARMWSRSRAGGSPHAPFGFLLREEFGLLGGLACCSAWSIVTAPLAAALCVDGPEAEHRPVGGAIG